MDMKEKDCSRNPVVKTCPNLYFLINSDPFTNQNESIQNRLWSHRRDKISISRLIYKSIIQAITQEGRMYLLSPYIIHLITQITNCSISKALFFFGKAYNKIYSSLFKY